MSIAARWCSWCSILVAAAGLAATYTRATNDAARGAPLFRLFTVGDEVDEPAVQSCFDLHSGLVWLARDDDERVVTVLSDADGPITRCLDDAVAKRGRLHHLTFSVAVKDGYAHHAVDDPWAPRTEPPLFPPKSYRCGGADPLVSVSTAELRSLEQEAASCEPAGEMDVVELRLREDGRIAKLFIHNDVGRPHVEPSTRVSCLVETVCQYRFEADRPVILVGAMSHQPPRSVSQRVR